MPRCKPIPQSPVCHEGDVWVFDTCGQPVEMRDECGALLCREGACEQQDPDGCGEETPQGRCNGDVVVTCHAGKVVAIDCAAAQQRCTQGEEGVVCRPPPERPCDGEVPRCVDDQLEVCAEGELHRVDCEGLGGECKAAPDGARCVVHRSHQGRVAPGAGGPDDECGPCGCRAAEQGPPGPEVCDGYDNDGDGQADEGTDCGVVDIVAFVISSSTGHTSYSEADLQMEVARINVFFGQLNPETRLQFRLADAIAVQRNEWLVADTPAIYQMAAHPDLHPVRPGFYVPVVFTDGIQDGLVPKLGSATLPPGACGGLQKLHPAQTLGGVVVLAKARSETTGAHEVGHFLGLCHTHRVGASAVVEQAVRSGEAGEQPVDCTGCRQQGDGICDTPFDPGPGVCTYDMMGCTPICTDDSDPDVTNLMGYYHECRTDLTMGQSVMLRRILAQRRRWTECLVHSRCPCAPEQDTDCPAPLRCLPMGSDDGWACGIPPADGRGQ